MSSHPWRIRDIAPDFTVEDVWALPVHGDADDFDALVEIMTTGRLIETASWPTRALWQTRDLLGRWFGLGRTSTAVDSSRDGGRGPLPIPGTKETTLRVRLPADLCNTTAEIRFDSVPFAPLYRTTSEFAAELSNRTGHAVMHLAWVDQGGDCYQGQMAVYVKPRGPLGEVYMAFIKPFRHWVVYPELMRQVERAWMARAHSVAFG